MIRNTFTATFTSDRALTVGEIDAFLAALETAVTEPITYTEDPNGE